MLSKEGFLQQQHNWQQEATFLVLVITDTKYLVPKNKYAKSSYAQRNNANAISFWIISDHIAETMRQIPLLLGKKQGI
ncbi:hypothetical protein ACE1AT_29150 [Pelatocladus sp. BLCC-F211]|uniref:hypothetical protein n=1 Tax=Pelatocladus sp. BLCC-F211 TaxID=3342752 RepID=UPI0035BA5B1A